MAREIGARDGRIYRERTFVIAGGLSDLVKPLI